MSGTSSFPPSGQTTLQAVIPSYLYKNFSDDENLQAFVDAFNELAQSYLDWFNTVELPVYTGQPVSGLLLDWVAEGLYGISRPALPAGRNQTIGPLNTAQADQITPGSLTTIQNVTYYVVTDDIFRRIITWHFFKGDGHQFTVKWLKKRIARFLTGSNGTAPDIDQTNQISVTFGTNYQVDITIISGVRQLTGGAFPNRAGCNQWACNTITSSYTALTPVAEASVFASAVNAGVLELPFQFTWVVNVRT